MNEFDLLNAALQHHIVNSLGWNDLRPFQKAVIRPILVGRHMLVIAPTAGGKTEAALFPVLSRMLDKDWRRLSVLYICPIKALLNNLNIRLDRYLTLLGRRSALWHGDISPTAREKILQDPPDCLLTTPESIEVMLTSRKVDHRTFLADLRVIIIDEVHAFAGDDRGWHLLAVLERISRIAGREMQRIGLSATVGNPEALAQWLRGGGQGPYAVQQPEKSGGIDADVKVDFVGSLDNAAVVISRLYRGEKRLVFTDSRSRAEQLGAALRKKDVTVFVTHSSLSPGQRRQAEHAFSERDDCVIVATSVLELGIDVGNLDRTIQIDAPATVSSFLQRMGRTGRRAGTKRNYLFLATSEDALLHACGLVHLWQTGWVEPLMPPPIPYHVFSQQLMALALQEGGIGARTWEDWLDGFLAIAGLDRDSVNDIIRFMVAEDILWMDQGLLWFGRKGEQEFGFRHFMEVLSMVAGDPLFTVKHGREELGLIHPMSFLSSRNEDAVILLAGRSWAVRHIDWKAKIAYVEAVAQPGRSRWVGAGMSMGFEVCRAIGAVLQTDAEALSFWSKRTSQKMFELRETMNWMEPGKTVFEYDSREIRWWTFAGDAANRTLCRLLKHHLQLNAHPGSLAIVFRNSISNPAEWVDRLQTALDFADTLPIDDELLDGLKFSQCLPREIGESIIRKRFSDLETVKKVLGENYKTVFQTSDV